MLTGGKGVSSSPLMCAARLNVTSLLIWAPLSSSLRSNQITRCTIFLNTCWFTFTFLIVIIYDHRHWRGVLSVTVFWTRLFWIKFQNSRKSDWGVYTWKCHGTVWTYKTLYHHMVRCKIVLQPIKRVHGSHTQQYVGLQKDLCSDYFLQQVLSLLKIYWNFMLFEITLQKLGKKKKTSLFFNWEIKVFGIWAFNPAVT